MPNWIEGTMKLRGKREDIKRFIEGCLEPCVDIFGNSLGDIKNYVVDESDEGGLYFDIRDEVHIKGSRRAFVQPCFIGLTAPRGTVALDIKQAWGFIGNVSDRDGWEKLSRDYNLDIKLFGIEKGMEFAEEVIIIGGQGLIDNEIHYEDWNWDCPFPNMGG